MFVYGSLNCSVFLGHVVADRLLVIYLMVGYRPQMQKKVRRKHKHSWSHGRYHDVTGKRRRLHHAAAQVFFAIVNSPCLGDHISSDAWRFTDASHYILETNPPSLQRCAQNSDLLAFVKQASPKVGLPSWMAILWVKHDSLSKGVLDQMGKET